MQRILSWPWSYGSWIYNYLFNQCLSPLILWVRLSLRVRCSKLCDKVCQWLTARRRFSPGPPVFSNNKTDCHDITEILLKVALNTTSSTKPTCNVYYDKQGYKYIVYPVSTYIWSSTLPVCSESLIRRTIIQIHKKEIEQCYEKVFPRKI